MKQSSREAAARIVGYQFGAMWGWFIGTAGYPLWLAIVVATLASIVAGWVIDFLYRRA